MRREIDDNHEGKKNFLRVAGILILLVGIGFMAVGTIDFFMEAGSNKYFWCNFVGMPLLFIGITMLSAGFSGALARYSAAETAPVARDTFNYMAEGTKEGVETLARSIHSGLSGGVSSVVCGNCNTKNDGNAKFCDNCGDKLTTVVTCSFCGDVNSPDAKFCKNCGKRF
ncbi:MAG: zinc ribbon domain-containing protein [Spirochaetales bacterium]|nr:zinc ribbon domain-containing protein [Spirochaetales bacterium]